MTHTYHVLLDDRARIQLFGHVVARSADQFYAAQRSLVVRLGADEGRQEAVVNVDDLACVFFAQVRRQNLHVARQNHHFSSVLLDQT